MKPGDDPNGPAAAKSAWRSSRPLIVFTATLGLFTENFLYGFLIPIIPYMFENRLGLDPAYTQRYASSLLFLSGFVSILATPVIGHFADKTPDRRTPLLLALAGTFFGTALVATTPSVWAMFLGRMIYGVAGSAAWIVCFAMLTDTIDKKHFGKTLGIASTFITSGVLTGPAVAGALVQWLGYWPAWSIPFILLTIDLLARLVIVERRRDRSAVVAVAPTNSNDEAIVVDPDERTALLPEDINETPRQQEPVSPPDISPPQGFYRTMLIKGSIISALANTITFAIIVSAFDATFPLHLRRVFDWGPAPTGLIFLGLQIPGMIIAPFVGWLRDRVGLRWPTAVGWLLLAPLLWFLGVPGELRLPGLDTVRQGEIAFVTCIVGMGIVAPLVRGGGTLQLTMVLRETEEKEPQIFGPNGGSSRMFALTEIAFNVGLMIGPVIGGALTDTLGFYWMMLFLAVLAILVAINSAVFFLGKRPTEAEEEAEA